MSSKGFGEGFEWDSEKADSNLKKHKVSFEVGAEVFNDPQALSFTDNRVDYGEVREVAIGDVGGVILYVVFTVRGERIRIISARKANRDERRAYYDYFTQRTAGDPSQDE